MCAYDASTGRSVAFWILRGQEVRSCGWGPDTTTKRLMNKTSLSAIATVIALTASSLVACGGADAQAPAAAPIGAASTAAPAAAGVTGSFGITPQNSKIEWTGSKTSGHHDGAFSSFKGTITIPGAIEQGNVSVDIDTPSIVINDPALGAMAEKLKGHLSSPDFFDVAKFGKATFTSTAIKAGGDNGATHTITGTLAFHGATKTISFPATITATGAKVDATATFNINRKDFGLNYPGKPDDAIKDDVQIRLTIHADKT